MEPQDIPRTMDYVLEHHGSAFCFTLGTLAFATGYVGLHWLARRRFYRRKLADPFPTYFAYWRTHLMETWLALGFTGSLCFGLLCWFVGIIDAIDG